MSVESKFRSFMWRDATLLFIAGGAICFVVILVIFATTLGSATFFSGNGGKALLAISSFLMVCSSAAWAIKRGYSVSGLSFVLILAPFLFLWVNGGHGFNLGDGIFYTQTARFIREWLEPFSLSGTLPLQGFGNTMMPMSIWLSPVYSAVAFLPLSIGPLVATIIAFLLIFGLAVAAGRVLSVPHYISWTAALAYSAMTFPPVCLATRFNCLSLLNPSISFTTWLLIFCFAAFVHVLKGSGTARYGILLMLFTVWSFLTDPLWFAIAVLSCSLFFISALLVSWPPKREAIVIFLVVLVILVVVGIPQYIYGVSQSIARTWFGDEIFGVPKTYHVAFLPFRGAMGLVFFGIAFSTFILGTIRGAPLTRVLCAASIVHMLIMIGITSIFLYTNINWTYPSPRYLEFTAWPFYFFAMSFALFSVTPKRLESVLTVSLPVLFFTAASWYTAPYILSGKNIEVFEFLGKNQFRPESTEVIKYLSDRTSLHPGDVFRGLTATFVGVDRTAGEVSPSSVPRPFGATVAFDYAENFVVPNFGANHLRWNGLWEFSIPTIESYSQMTSVPGYFILSRLLGRPTDEYGRNRTFVSVFRPNILGLSGVRYVLADHIPQNQGFEVVQTFEGLMNGRIHILELSSWNQQGYSPTRVTRINTAPAIIERMKNDDFNPESELIVDSGVLDGLELSKAASEPLIIDRQGMHVSATSPEWSVLILPRQYTNCLTIADFPDARLFRANIAYTGLLFRGAFNGVIENALSVGSSQCLLQDIEDFKRLGIASDGTIKIPNWTRPHSLFNLN